MELLLSLLAVCALLVAGTDAQVCPEITADDLGSSSAPSGQGLIAQRLAVNGQPAVQLLRFNVVCEVTAGIQGGYRHASLVAEYRNNGVMELAQFDFSCVEGNSMFAWSITAGGSTENTVTFNPSADFSTPLRRDCYFCLNPMRPGASAADEIHHCAPCPSQCVGLRQCRSQFTCCNYYNQAGTCVQTCPSPTVPQADNTCDCPLGTTGANCDIPVNFCDPNPCMNSGICTGITGGFECTCLMDHTGERCETLVDPCDATPCLNGGTCTRDSSTEFTCACPEGYAGDTCLDGPCASDNTTFEGITTLSWPVTNVGMTATVPCPFSNATRQCRGEGVWLEPNTTTCRGLANSINLLTNELMEMNLDEHVQTFADMLSPTPSNLEQQTPEVLAAAAEFFSHVAVLISNNDSNNTPISQTVIGELVGSLSSLQQWEPAVATQNDDTSRIIMSFEIAAIYFAEQVPTTFTETEEGIIFVADNNGVVDLQEKGIYFSFNDTNTFFQAEERFLVSPAAIASVSLPPSLFSTIEDRNSVGVFFALYEEPTLFPVRDMEQPSNSTLRPAVASGIVATTIGRGLDFTGLDSPVEVNLKITNKFMTVRNGSETCVSWDFTAADGAGNWTTEGCVKESVSDDGSVMCRCSHLTNFAILVDICERVSDCETNEVVEVVLEVISYIGVVLSLIGLIITVITLLLFRRLRQRDNSKYHIQLSIAIFCMLLVFIAGIDQTAVYGGCVVVSLLIHYFSLAAVMWMGAEAVLMFQKLVFVFRKVTRRGIIITSVVCWAAPLVPVLISLIVDLATGTGPDSDLIVRRDHFCFLSNGVVFWVTFLAPIFVIVLFNTVVCVVVIVILVRHTRHGMARRKESLNRKTTIRLMTSIAGVMFLFGLSWLFGALTITVPAVRLTFQILFAIFTSLQGFFIFVFFCALSKVARELWKETLSCGRYRSKFLNPHRVISTDRSGEKSHVPKNGTSTGTRETTASIKPDFSSSTGNVIDSLAESIGESYSEPKAKVDLAKEEVSYIVPETAPPPPACEATDQVRDHSQVEVQQQGKDNTFQLEENVAYGTAQ